MNKPLKYSLIGIGGLLLLVIAAAVIFVMTFDANRYKPQVERLVQEKTGRTLKLQGPLEATVWPSLGAKVSGVTFSERGSDRQFLAEIWDANPLLREYLGSIDNPEFVLYRIRPTRVRYMREWALEYHEVPIG